MTRRQTDLRWFDPTHDFQVGETVVMTSVNFRKKEVPVMKVGRKLLYVEEYGRPRTFRIDQRESRPADDHYQHEAILTLEEVAYRDKVRDARSTLTSLGIGVDQPHTWPIERLKAIIRAAMATGPFPEGDHS